MKQETEQVKKFNFFKQDEIKDQRVNNDNIAPTLNDIPEINEGCGIGSKLFLSSTQKQTIYIYEGNSIQGQFQPHLELRIMRCTNQSRDGILVTFGIDQENNNSKSSYVKLWDINTNDYTQLKPKKIILINKAGMPLQNYNCFTISKDLTAMAFGMQDGSILLYKSKNLLTSEFKESYQQADQEPIKSVHFSSKKDQNLNMFCTTDSNIICFQNLQNRIRFNVPGGTLFDISAQGNLIGAPKDDNLTICEFSEKQKEQNKWQFDGQKMELRCFKQHYIVMIIAPKSDKEQVDQSVQLIIYDLLNTYVAYHKKYDRVQKFICAGDNLFLITTNRNKEKQLYRLTEMENTHKIEVFFKNNFFDVMHKFAENQSSDKALLAEICRLHGDFLYEKHDFQNAIKQYIATAGFLEPSYVIGKFLDVSHVDYLISYLAALHHQKKADRNHTALLLNCYVKQKQISKLEEFLKESTFDSDLFDIETAIKECRQLEYTDLALRLAETKKENEHYLRILIEDKKDCRNALIYIREKIPLDSKSLYLKEFGQALMKQEPDLCLEIIEQLVLLIGIAPSIKKKMDPTKNLEIVKLLTPDEIKVCQYFKLTDDAIETLIQTTFSKPDEFLHLFVVNNEYLENYLKFLIDNCKTLQNNDKTIFHRYFEYHLETYAQFYKVEQKRDATVMEKEKNIMALLENQENEKKYDKNHLLVLFKMYNFTPGIIFLLKKLQMREELLNFYIGQKSNDQIIQLCKEFGKKETNLWIQALKYFAKPENSAEDRINEVLREISELSNLSPLLILNILAKNNNVNFKLVKFYFIEKIRKDRIQMEEDQRQVKDKMKKSSDLRQEYKKLKTQAKVFQSTKCAQCDNPLTLPSFHFLCGHSFHENCIQTENNLRICCQCNSQDQMYFKRKAEFEEGSNETKAFKEKLHERPDKFDVICEYLGHGIVKNSQ